MQLSQINEKIVADLPAPAKGYEIHWAGGLELQKKSTPPGFGVRVTAAGTRSFILFYRAKGKPHVATIGRHGALKVVEAIIKADRLYKDIANERVEDTRPARTQRAEDKDKPKNLTVGGAYDPEGEQTEKGLLDLFVERYCRKEKELRSADQYASTFRRLVAPDIGDLPIFGEGRLRRSHIVELLDEIEDESGPVMADRTLAYLRKAFNWFAARNEEFVNPIVKGIREISAAGRDRVLSDDEIRDLWAALEIVEDVPAFYPRYVKTLLLTVTRRNEAALMHSAEIDGRDWTIPGERYKTGIDHMIPLSDAALELIGTKPAGSTANSWFVFSSTGGAKGFSGFSKAKRQLDRAIAKVRTERGAGEMPRWTLHDLRRSGRSLMSRAGVQSDHAERCLGHVIGGVRGVYDRYAYLDEKRDAFAKLAALVASIVAARSVQVRQ